MSCTVLPDSAILYCVPPLNDCEHACAFVCAPSVIYVNVIYLHNDDVYNVTVHVCMHVCHHTGRPGQKVHFIAISTK